MGHIRLGRLPNTPNWRKVVGLVAGNAPVASVAAVTMDAARRGLELADGDEGLSHTFWLLTQIPLAAREDDFADALKRVEISVHEPWSALGIVAGFTDAVDRHLRHTGERTDIGEMAQLAASETLANLCREELTTLFGAGSEQVKQAVRGFSTHKGFSALAHQFFARFIQRFLGYHLSRELSNHVGAGKRFADTREHTEFVENLNVHCRQAALIVREFAGGWYSKTQYETGITPNDARGFIHVALKKLRKELKRRGIEDVE